MLEEKSDNKGITMTDFSSRHAHILGGMWIASFGCSMYSITSPFIGQIGNFIAIFSLYQLYSIIVTYRLRVENIGLRKCWLLGCLVCLFTSLLTTLAQYIYFLFIDQGQLMSQIITLMESPEYTKLLSQSLPTVDINEMIQVLRQITVADMTAQLLSFNLFISVPFALIAALFAAKKRISPKVSQE